jgi:hypothetical protein
MAVRFSSSRQCKAMHMTEAVLWCSLHSCISCMLTLHINFPGWWIETCGHIPQSSRSADLTPLGLSLQGYIKGHSVCHISSVCRIRNTESPWHLLCWSGCGLSSNIILTSAVLCGLFLLFILWYFQWLDYIASNVRMFNEWWVGKDMDRSSCGIIKVLSQNLHGGTEENMKNLCQDSQWLGWDMNQTFPKYESRVLPLNQSIWYKPVNGAHTGLYWFIINSLMCNFTIQSSFHAYWNICSVSTVIQQFLILISKGHTPAGKEYGCTVVVLRGDSPGKAAQWMGRSIRENWEVLWLVIRLHSARADVSRSFFLVQSS